MAVVPQEAIDQFGALMEEGQLSLISFLNCFLIFSLMAPLLIFCCLLFFIIFVSEFYAVDGSLKRTFQVRTCFLFLFAYFLLEILLMPDLLMISSQNMLALLFFV